MIPVHTRHLMHQQILILHTQHIGATLFSHLTVSIGSSQLPCFQACPVMLCSPYSRVIRAIRGIFKITRLTYSMLTLPMFRDYPHHSNITFRLTVDFDDLYSLLLPGFALAVLPLYYEHNSSMPHFDILLLMTITTTTTTIIASIH